MMLVVAATWGTNWLFHSDKLLTPGKASRLCRLGTVFHRHGITSHAASYFELFRSLNLESGK